MRPLTLSLILGLSLLAAPARADDLPAGRAGPWTLQGTVGFPEPAGIEVGRTFGENRLSLGVGYLIFIATATATFDRVVYTRGPFSLLAGASAFFLFNTGWGYDQDVAPTWNLGVGPVAGIELGRGPGPVAALEGGVLVGRFPDLPRIAPALALRLGLRVGWAF